MQERCRFLLILMALLTCLLSACGGSGGQPPSGGDETTPDNPGVTPNPLDVNVVLDDSRATSQTVSLEGGMLEVTAADGTVYTLTIPADALLSETDISMTPITAIEDAPVRGAKLLGVSLKPEGLRLYSAATLTITPADGNAAAHAVSFAYRSNGKGFHLYPLVPDPNKLSFKLLHFSGYGAYLASDEEAQLTLSPEDFMPALWEAQLEHQLQQLLGNPGDPHFEEKLEALLRSYYGNVVSPLLSGISTNCGSLEANGAKVLAWARTTQLFGGAGTFEAENNTIMSSLITGLKNCWAETVEPCLDWNNEAQVNKAVSVARQLVILGESSAQYNPFDPELRCENCDWVRDVQEWTGRASFEFSASDASDSLLGDENTSVTINLRHSADLTSQLSRESSAEGTHRWGNVSISGNVLVDNTWVTTGGGDWTVTWTEDGSGPPGNTDAYPSVATLEINPDKCVYTLAIHVITPVLFTFESEEGGGNSVEVAGGGGFRIVNAPLPTDPVNHTLSGASSMPVFPLDPDITQLNLLSTGLVVLADIRGRGNVGFGDVSWSFTPAEP